MDSIDDRFTNAYSKKVEAKPSGFNKITPRIAEVECKQDSEERGEVDYNRWTKVH